MPGWSQDAPPEPATAPSAPIVTGEALYARYPAGSIASVDTANAALDDTGTVDRDPTKRRHRLSLGADAANDFLDRRRPREGGVEAGVEHGDHPAGNRCALDRDMIGAGEDARSPR